MNRIVKIVGLLALTALFITACTEDDTEYSVVGTWNLVSDIRTIDFSIMVTDSLGNEQTLTCNDFDEYSCEFFCEWDGDSCETAVEDDSPEDGESATLTLYEDNTLTLVFVDMESCNEFDYDQDECEEVGCTYNDYSCSGEDFVDEENNTGTWSTSGGTLTVLILDDDDEEPEIESFSYVVDETTLTLTQTFSEEDYYGYDFDYEINLSGEWQMIFERE